MRITAIATLALVTLCVAAEAAWGQKKAKFNLVACRDKEIMEPLLDVLMADDEALLRVF